MTTEPDDRAWEYVAPQVWGPVLAWAIAVVGTLMLVVGFSLAELKTNGFRQEFLYFFVPFSSAFVGAAWKLRQAVWRKDYRVSFRWNQDYLESNTYPNLVTRIAWSDVAAADYQRQELKTHDGATVSLLLFTSEVKSYRGIARHLIGSQLVPVEIRSALHQSRTKDFLTARQTIIISSIGIPIVTFFYAMEDHHPGWLLFGYMILFFLSMLFYDRFKEPPHRIPISREVNSDE